MFGWVRFVDIVLFRHDRLGWYWCLWFADCGLCDCVVLLLLFLWFKFATVCGFCGLRVG